MNQDLARQQEAFKKSLQRQPVIEKKIAPSVAVATTTIQASASSASSIDSLSEELRFDDTSVRHINSYVHAIISFLKVSYLIYSHDNILASQSTSIF